MSKEVTDLNTTREYAYAHISELPKLNDEEFVCFVRAAEQQHPDIKSLSIWANTVRLELDFRLLLKPNTCHAILQ